MKVEPLQINPMDLSGRTILVTGASSGIGRETAVLLSQLNARLILTARNEERLTATLSTLHNDGHRPNPLTSPGPREIPKWVERVAAQAGPLYAIVHAAGKQAAIPIRFVTEEESMILFGPISIVPSCWLVALVKKTVTCRAAVSFLFLQLPLLLRNRQSPSTRQPRARFSE